MKPLNLIGLLAASCMGDIVSLVEKAQETIEAEQAERMMKRFQKGQFNMNDLRTQLEQMMKMGGMEGIMGMLPGMGKMAKQIDQAGIDDKVFKHQIALINSMTKKERANPRLLQASRKKRIAAGAGMEVRIKQTAENAPSDGRYDEKDGQRRHAETGDEGHVRQRRWIARGHGPQPNGPQGHGSRGKTNGHGWRKTARSGRRRGFAPWLVWFREKK